MEDEAAQLELARQLRTTTQATDAQIKAVEQSISAFSKQTAMADDQLRPALANLVRATGSLELSQKAMAVTADLATAKNIDMETASVAVSKALAGQTTALIKLDPSLKGVIDSSSSADEIMQALNNSVGGAAETFANSAEGGLKTLASNGRTEGEHWCRVYSCHGKVAALRARLYDLFARQHQGATHRYRSDRSNDSSHRDSQCRYEGIQRIPVGCNGWQRGAGRIVYYGLGIGWRID